MKPDSEQERESVLEEEEVFRGREIRTRDLHVQKSAEKSERDGCRPGGEPGFTPHKRDARLMSKRTGSSVFRSGRPGRGSP